MEVYKQGELRKKTDRPLMEASIVHGEGVTMSRWDMKRGAELADHSHPHAQITYVASGAIAFRREGGEPYTATAGDFIVFAPNEIHGGTAVGDSIVFDVFSPAREDFKKELGWPG